MFMPLSINLECKTFLVVGGGKVATRRILKLVEFGVDINVVSPNLDESISGLGNKVKWVTSKYQKKFLQNANYVIAATDDLKINEQIRLDCNKFGIPCLDVSNGMKSDFHIPAIIKKDFIQISVSTQGKSPGVAKKIKNEIGSWLDDEWIEKANELSIIRQLIKENVESHEKREQKLREVNELSLNEIILRRKYYEDKYRY